MKYIFLFFCTLILRHITLAQNSISKEVPLRNVIVIIGDDHAAYALDCYGSDIVHTPNLDRLSNKGTRFERAYVNSPVCTPSRQSFLTGKMPHAAGVTLLNTALSDSTYTIPEHLRKKGIKTGAVGKTHFNSSLSHGFDYVVTAKGYNDYIKTIQENLPAGIRFRNTKNPWTDSVRVWWNADGLPAAHYDKNDIGTYFAGQANNFIEQNKNNRFCLWVGFQEPHSPFNFPIEFANRFQPGHMPLPSGSPEDDRWEPLVFKPLSEKDRRGIIRSYYTSVEYLDKNIGLILDKVEALNLDRETLIIYLGDNGYLLNHHKRFEKHTMWEEAARVPLIIKAGKSQTPKIVNSLTEMVDLAPTILEALGVESMPGLHGKSLMPVLNGKTTKHKDVIFSEYLPDNMAMVRTDRFKYIYMNGKRDLDLGYATGNGPAGIYHALYDLKNDPGETINLAKQEANKARVLQMQKEMLKIFRKTHPKANTIPRNISIEQQLAHFCNPPEGEKPGEYLNNIKEK